MTSPVAFLGTGLLGGALAERLIASGFSLRVWNRSAGRALGLERAGAIRCGQAAEAVADAKYVCLCLADANAVEDVLFRRYGVASALPKTATVIDFSTIGPHAARLSSEKVQALSGAAWLDCPVSGGVAGARDGSLTVFAGGDRRVLEGASPLLNAIAARVTYVGRVGAGQSAKLCNQLIVATTLVAIAEAIALGEALSLDPSVLPQALAGGFADSKPLQIFGSRMAQSAGPERPDSRLEIMHKDIAAISAAARASGAETPLLAAVSERYRILIEAGYGEEDLSALRYLYQGLKTRE